MWVITNGIDVFILPNLRLPGKMNDISSALFLGSYEKDLRRVDANGKAALVQTAPPHLVRRGCIGDCAFDHESWRRSRYTVITSTFRVEVITVFQSLIW